MNNYPSRRFRVLMVCDFFYPQLGGVEMHIWSLSQYLIAKGHKVVVMTHAYANRKGIRFMAGGLKVYYLPLRPLFAGTIFPTFLAMYPLMRQILIRERISIVHGHQAASVMTQEAIIFAKVMGYKVAYTDHSLFGFDDIAGIHLNKYTRFIFSHVDRAICVSHMCRENLVLRSFLSPENVYVIPNAIDGKHFMPDISLQHPKDKINVVLITRLVYRKGVDLIVPVISIVAQRDPRFHFIIGGDGPKRLLLEEMREKYILHDRVEILGAVPHSEVRGVLCRGHIFLNCSLTDSFCIAILEAAACGLHVVSTRVGGIPEVLPRDMVTLAEPRVGPLVDALLSAAEKINCVHPEDLHCRVVDMYSWEDVSNRTEVVYEVILNEKHTSLREQLNRFRRVGPFGQIICSLLESWLYILWKILEFFQPMSRVQIAPDWCISNQSEKPKFHRDERGY